MNILVDLGIWFRPYQYQTAMAIVATLLVVFGQDINNVIKGLIAKRHLLIRVSVFVLVCTFGYGVLTVWLTELLTGQLAKIPHMYIIPLILLIFFMLGYYAQKQKHI